MDFYYENENLTFYLSDDHDKSNESSLKCEYSRPIKLKQKMELALAHICCPKSLKYFPTYDEYYVDFHLHYTKSEQYKMFGLQESPLNLLPSTIRLRRYVFEPNDPNLLKNEISNEIFYDKIKDMETYWNKFAKLYMNPKIFNINFNVDDPDDEMFIVKHAKNLNSETEVYFRKMRIFQKRSKFLILRNLPLTLDITRIDITPHILPDNRKESETILIGYVVFSKALHGALKFDEDKYPLNIYSEKEIPDQVYKHLIRKIDTSNLDEKIGNLEIGIPPEIIYIYCDIIIDSYKNDKKVNVLQLFSPKYNTQTKFLSMDFKNLIYMPVRFDEIHSITIELRDRFGRLLQYKRGGITVILKLRPIEHI
jgi:hypothetical protein